MLIPILFAVALLPGCGKSNAHGTANSLIIAAPPEIWAQVEDSVEAALEPRIFTVRQERAFRTTHVDPQAAAWGDVRKFVQVLVIGSREDPWVAEALEERDRGEAPEPPTLVQVHNVWAYNQQVTVLLIPETGGPDDVLGLLDELGPLMDDQYRQWARSKMFLSGRDTALADTLRQTAGFHLLLPQVYDWRTRDSVFVFRNDNPDPSELIRQLGVTWRSPPPEELTRDYVMAWREEMVREHYNQGQETPPEDLDASPATFRDHQAFQVQGTWRNPPDLGWPAAGPFITRAVVCPEQDRVYLLDAWLYAPGKDKYEYMIQLETVLDSFQCGES